MGVLLPFSTTVPMMKRDGLACSGRGDGFRFDPADLNGRLNVHGVRDPEMQVPRHLWSDFLDERGRRARADVDGGEQCEPFEEGWTRAPM